MKLVEEKDVQDPSEQLIYRNRVGKDGMKAGKIGITNVGTIIPHDLQLIKMQIREMNQ